MHLGDKKGKEEEKGKNPRGNIGFEICSFSTLFMWEKQRVKIENSARSRESEVCKIFSETPPRVLPIFRIE